MEDVWYTSPGVAKALAEDMDDLDAEILELENEGLLDWDYSDDSNTAYNGLDEDEYVDIYEDGTNADYSWLEMYYLNGCLE